MTSRKKELHYPQSFVIATWAMMEDAESTEGGGAGGPSKRCGLAKN